MKSKGGNLKKSKGDRRKLEAALDGTWSIGPAGEQSGPAKRKPKPERGRRQKSESEGQELQIALVRQDLQVAMVSQDVQVVLKSRSSPRLDQPIDDKMKSNGGSSKSSESDRQDLTAPVEGTRNTAALGKKSKTANMKSTRGRPKISEGGKQELQVASQSSPLGEQSNDDTVMGKHNGAQKSEDCKGKLEAKIIGTVSTAPVGVQPEAPKMELRRGRSRKSQGDGQTPEVAELGHSPLLREQSEPANLKSKRGRSRNSEGGSQETQAAIVSQSPRGEKSIDYRMHDQSSRAKKFEDERRNLEAGVAGTKNAAPLGDQFEASKLKLKRGRSKKSRGDEQKPEAAEVRQSPSPEEQPLEEKQKAKRFRHNEPENDARDFKVADRMQNSTPPGEHLEIINQKRTRGRPKKSISEGKQTAATGEQQVIDKRRRGKPPASGQGRSLSNRTASKASAPKVPKRRCLTKIEIDGTVFEVGDDVYVRKSEGSTSESDTEVEDCRICGTANEETMLECDSCLAGYHLTCLNPPLESVPEGDWLCPYCEKGEKPPESQTSQQRHRTARERLLACDLWAARIERMWKDADGMYWFTAHWFLVPEETALGRQPHNGKRELFRSSLSDDNELDSILRHCYVMSPQDYNKSTGEGDDVFFCEYEYNEQWCKFKRIEYLDDNENWSDDEPFGTSDDSEEEGEKKRRFTGSKKVQQSKSIRAANKRGNYSSGIKEVGAKSIPDDVRKRPKTDFERAKAALALSAIPSSLPCRDRERSEISAFLKESVAAGEHCLGRCLYISGVPGTGKTATVLEVIKELGTKVDLGELPPYRFVEINGLRLPSPEHVYTILHEALTGQHLGWKRALQFLDERFSNAKPVKELDARPCVLLVDELDLLVTNNQSVLYNIFDWPSRPQSRLIIIGIANTMDLPERMLPRIASRMGMQRISFGPYSHEQLEEIISARLKGVPVFDKQAAEFASRKVAAVSGDIRRALELCRRAVEVAQARLKHQSLLPVPASCDPSTGLVVATTQDTNQGLPANRQMVTMTDVDAAIGEMFEAPQIQTMKRSPKLAKVFLVAMVYEQRRTSMAETTFEKVAVTCSELCSNNREETPDWDTLLAIGCKLGASRLLLCESGARHRLQKLQLNFPCDDVSFALKNDKEVPWFAKYL